MIWWKPTYPAPLYQTWSASLPFRMRGTLGNKLVDSFFLPSKFPEPENDRDRLRW